MLKYASKFFFEKIMPSVVATVAGAYIVNHYVVSKPADAPVAAAVSAATPDKAVSNIPGAGVRAKGISEKAVAKEQTAKVQPETPAEKPVAEKSAGESEEAASLSADIKKHQAPPHDKAVAKATPAPSQTASVADDRHDANDLARAAIDRLRTNDAPARVDASRSQPEIARQDAVRQPAESSPPRVQEAARVAPQPAMQPLPPAIQVSVPAVETFNPDGRPVGKPQSDRADTARRLVPPADIPEASRPLDLAANSAPEMRPRTTMADDVLSAAKSVFRAVIPQ